MRNLEETPEGAMPPVPLLVGIFGAQGSGKTYSALRLAAGMQAVQGGEIHYIDTESGRALHYRKPRGPFDFRHFKLTAPFSPLDYLAAIEHCKELGATTLVIDSASHEHEGPGGVLEWHARELDRMAGNDFGKRNRMTFSAWAEPKAARRRLINTVVQLGINAIFCFRAKEKLKPQPGKQPLELGWMPISGDEWLYEMTLNCLLYPSSGGVPTWKPDYPGERTMIKLPKQFEEWLLGRKGPLDEEVGQRLAEWAKGGDAPKQPAKPASREPAEAPPESDAPKITEAQAKRLWAIASARAGEVGGTNKEIVRAVLASVGLESTRDIGRDQYDAIVETIQGWEPGGDA